MGVAGSAPDSHPTLGDPQCGAAAAGGCHGLRPPLPPGGPWGGPAWSLRSHILLAAEPQLLGRCRGRGGTSPAAPQRPGYPTPAGDVTGVCAMPAPTGGGGEVPGTQRRDAGGAGVWGGNGVGGPRCLRWGGDTQASGWGHPGVAVPQDTLGCCRAPRERHQVAPVSAPAVSQRFNGGGTDTHTQRGGGVRTAPRRQGRGCRAARAAAAAPSAGRAPPAAGCPASGR